MTRGHKRPGCTPEKVWVHRCCNADKDEANREERALERRERAFGKKEIRSQLDE